MNPVSLLPHLVYHDGANREINNNTNLSSDWKCTKPKTGSSPKFVTIDTRYFAHNKDLSLFKLHQSLSH